MELRYNKDAEGFITEIGTAALYPHYEYALPEPSEINLNNYQWYREADGEWAKLTQEEFDEKYQAITE